MKHYSVAEIRASYEQKRDWERQFPVSYYIFRPLSFPLTSALSRLTNSAQAIAWAGLCVGIAACALLASRAFGPWPGIAGLALFSLLDAADGNMARATGSVTRYGKLLDGVLGKLVEGSYLAALAAGLYFSGDSGLKELLRPASPWTLLSGFIALAAMLYSGYLESAYDAMRAEASGGAPKDPGARIGSSRFRGNVVYAVFINLHAFNLQVLLLGLATLAGGETAFLVFIAGYYLVRLAVLFPYYLLKGRAELS